MRPRLAPFPRLRSPAGVVAALLLASCASAPRPAGGPPLPAGCHPDAELLVTHRARDALADRRARNRLGLPWVDALPPVAVRDAALCRRAARAAAGGRLPRGVAARATVVRAGGLYFVLGPTSGRAGEFVAVDVLDAEFRYLMSLAG
jgi:hypothetical protein